MKEAIKIKCLDMVRGIAVQTSAILSSEEKRLVAVWRDFRKRKFRRELEPAHDALADMWRDLSKVCAHKISGLGQFLTAADIVTVEGENALRR